MRIAEPDGLPELHLEEELVVDGRVGGEVGLDAFCLFSSCLFYCVFV